MPKNPPATAQSLAAQPVPKFRKPLFLWVGSQEKLFFTKHLATMIRAGVPLAESLATLRDQTRSSSLRYILANVCAQVENGSDLATSLKKFPGTFDQFYTGLLEVSEKSGTLDTNLAFMAQQLTKDQALKSKVTSALLYPGLVLLATIGMSGFIAFGVLPKLSDFFLRLQVNLPWTTKVLLFVAIAVKNYGVEIIAGLIAFILMFGFSMRIKSVRYVYHTMVLKVPMIGTLIKMANLSRFTRNLGTLLHSGVPVLTALEISSATLNNLKVQQELKLLASALDEGREMGATLLETHNQFFPALVSRMIAVGEKTGTLDETLLYLADFYDEEIDAVAKNLTTLLEPMLLLVIGLVVGFVALAIISPIYDLTGSISR